MKETGCGWVRVFVGLQIAAVIFILLLTGCHPSEKEDLRYGIDINRLNPLVMTAADLSTGQKVFSRDPSIISSVMSLFEKMECTPASEKTEDKGISFTVATMFGDFAFGECWGNRLRLSGDEYLLEKDYSEDIQLLYDRLASETLHTAEVSREIILSVKPEMTYGQLITKFGETLETAVVGEKKAWLYKYHGRPFYIRYKREEDSVGITGAQLLQQIWINYNLDKSLTPPESLGGGRLSVYKQAFDKIIDEYLVNEDSPLSQLIIDTDKLVYLTDEEQRDLAAYLKEKYNTKVSDSNLALMKAEGDGINPDDTDNFILLIKQYSYIGRERMNFVAAGSLNGNSVVRQNMEFVLRNHQWVAN
ncbi:MAG: hypothetical protein PHH84_08175 [Oscillospiraceae bacterium]|nr:hypothetical protein [Oscillospiraceae bacterium]MDD4413776.1 hypothetical protein [Oscillospiraceae bacterium]